MSAPRAVMSGSVRPPTWIGVRADWALYSDKPWSHLISVESRDLATHAYLVGKSGVGKSTLILHLAFQDLIRGQSIVVIDARGDMAGSVVELAARLVPAERFKYIDFRCGAWPTGFNPLAGAGQAYFHALKVLQVLERESESWGVRLAETLRNALMLLAEAGRSLLDLEGVFYDRAFRFDCLAKARTDSVIAYWQRFDEQSAEKQAVLADPVLNKASELLSTPTLRAVFGHPKPIDLGRHLNQPGSVLLVSLAADELHGAAHMAGSLIVASICREIFARVNQAESRRNPVRLYADEFQLLGMSEFETILTEGRRFKFSTVIAHQALAQLTPTLRSLILANVGTKFIFQTSREDSAILSRDLFGSPNAYDFTELPRGCMHLWQRDQGSVDVEVNEPLIRDVGRQNPEARAYLRQVHDLSGPAVIMPPVRPRIVEPEVPKVNQSAGGARTAPPADLEDWL
ncbi:MAG: type IV secretory system conjugative DNA transfer family protein [Fimbriimonadaceae bacterium]